MISLALRQVADFATGNAGAERALAQLQDYVCLALSTLSGKARPIASVAKAEKSATAFRAQLWQLVRVNDAAGDVAIRLPAADASNAGAEVWLARETAANAVTVTAEPTSVQGGASDTVPATAGLYRYVSTGEGWWRDA